MKKATLVLAVAVLGLLLLSSAALALNGPYTHGNFAENSKGCGDCHVTHSAGAAKLLNTTSNYQTTFCFGCHGKMSPFDVVTGQIVKDSADDGGPIEYRWDWSDVSDTTTSANTTFSLAGGFQFAASFEVGHTATTAGQVYSVHNVRGLTETVDIAGVTEGSWDGDLIPGGTRSIDFECGSCHDPHQGGQYQNDSSNKNPRLLKEDIFGRRDMRVKMQFNDDNTVTRYTYGFNNWCGSCHDVFDTSLRDQDTTWRSGADKSTVARDKYMHKFGVEVDVSKYATLSSPYNVKWLALEAGDRISCITCHRAHGSSADDSGLTWNRYTEYKDGADALTDTGTGSALLRLPNRDVCYDCHGAAEYNHDATHDFGE